MTLFKQLLKHTDGLLLTALWFVIFPVNLLATGDRAQTLTFENAIVLAQRNDTWLVGNQYSQNSIESMSVVVTTLPDPKISIVAANVAADSFNFSQEQMTQFKIGVSQMFPRGDSLLIKQKQLQLMASQYPLQRQDRKAKLVMTVGQLWLDTYKAQKAIHLIEKDRVLFEQLVDIAQASYSSAVGKTRQQDFIRAQLELTRLDDRLTALYQKRDVFLEQLSQWTNSFEFEHSELIENEWIIGKILPQLSLVNKALYQHDSQVTNQQLFEYFSKHPAVMAIAQAIKGSVASVDLAKQKHKPEWGVNASYGYRDSDPFGNERADLFSVGVTFDLPIFTSRRQDKQVESAIYAKQAVKTKKWQLLRQFITSFKALKLQLERLNERKQLYRSQLLPQMHQQAEASLTSYTNDDGDFSEVVRSKISALNATIEALDIDIERQKTILQLNYFFTTNSVTPIATYAGEGK